MLPRADIALGNSCALAQGPLCMLFGAPYPIIALVRIGNRIESYLHFFAVCEQRALHTQNTESRASWLVGTPPAKRV